MKIFTSVFIVFCMILPAFGTDCYEYKINPDINIYVPNNKKIIKSSNDLKDIYHGNVTAVLSENYEISVEQIKHDDGFCIILSDVKAGIGYSEFIVKIDSSHKKNSCEYLAILKHEEKHIDTYLSVINDNKKNIIDAVKLSSDMVVPKFIKDKSELDFIINEMYDTLSNNPDLKLLIKKIEASQELRNKELDYSGVYDYLKDCK